AARGSAHRRFPASEAPHENRRQRHPGAQGEAVARNAPSGGEPPDYGDSHTGGSGRDALSPWWLPQLYSSWRNGKTKREPPGSEGAETRGSKHNQPADWHDISLQPREDPSARGSFEFDRPVEIEADEG